MKGSVKALLAVAVLIPAYNCEKTISETLESVFAQSLPPDEIVVMDDGSTDGTAGLLGSYGPRITVLRQPNGGPASARPPTVALRVSR